MSKDANPGELRTGVIIEDYTENKDGDGYLIKSWKNIFSPGTVIKIKWVNLHGYEVYEAMSHGLKEPATLTSRYTPLITETCRLLKQSEKKKYDALLQQGKKTEAENLFFEIISIDNVDDQNEWIELKVQRKVNAK